MSALDNALATISREIRNPLHPRETARRVRKLLLSEHLLDAALDEAGGLKGVTSERQREIKLRAQEVANWGSVRRPNVMLAVLNQLRLYARWNRRYGRESYLEAAE